LLLVPTAEQRTPEYKNRLWCGLEWRSVRDLIKQKQDERIMLLRLDNADISGLRSIDGYVDIRHMQDTEVATAILKRLGMLTNLPLPEKAIGQAEPGTDIPDALQYWQQRQILRVTPLFNKIQEPPRWSIWV
jgi:hypothetical protein